MSTEENGELPEGWARAKLADLLRSSMNGFGKRKQDVGSPTIVLRLADIVAQEISLDDPRRVNSTDEEISKYRLQPGDLLAIRVNGSADLVGRLVGFRGASMPVMFCDHFIRLRLSDSVIPEIIRLYGESPEFRWYVESNKVSSAGQNTISQTSLEQATIPLPPLAEQRRIVAAVEAVLTKVNAARERLNRVPTLLKRFRQAVLSAACSGRLTEDWREKNPSIENAALLIAKHRKPEELRELEAGSLPEIPESWAWLALPDTGEMNRGKSRNRPRNAPHLYGGPYPFIQTGDIANSGGRIREHKQTYSQAGLEQSRLWAAGTVCITIAANIADSAILTYPACFPDSVVGVVTTADLCVAEYLEYFLRTARENLAAFAPATAQANINIAILNELAVPLPPLAEQQEIVRRVSDLFELADVIESRLTDARRMVDQLTQAVLAKAFRGELVPTEAELARRENRTYEPAADLLTRIRAERELSAPPSKRVGRRTRRGS